MRGGWFAVMSVLDGYKLFLKTILVRGKEEWGLGREQNCKLLYINKKILFGGHKSIVGSHSPPSLYLSAKYLK